MQVESQRPEPKTELAALYRQRLLLTSLIRSMEQYQRITAVPTRQCPQRSPQAA
jgi:hypothetical protein